MGTPPLKTVFIKRFKTRQWGLVGAKVLVDGALLKGGSTFLQFQPLIQSWSRCQCNTSVVVQSSPSLSFDISSLSSECADYRPPPPRATPIYQCEPLHVLPPPHDAKACSSDQQTAFRGMPLSINRWAAVRSPEGQIHTTHSIRKLEAFMSVQFSARYSFANCSILGPPGNGMPDYVQTYPACFQCRCQVFRPRPCIGR